MLPKAIYKFSSMPVKIPTKFFTDLGKMVLNFIQKNQKLRISKTILYNERTFGGITIPDFKLYYRAKVLKTDQYWYKNRQKNKWNQIEDPDINPHTYEHLIIDKEAKNIKWKKKSYLTNGAGISEYQHIEE